MELPGGGRMHKKGKQAGKRERMELPDSGRMHKKSEQQVNGKNGIAWRQENA